MGKRIAVPGPPDLPDKLALQVGDTAQFWATGAVLAPGPAGGEAPKPAIANECLETGPRPGPGRPAQHGDG